MFESIVSKIEQYDSIVIFGHLNPDGDCYGSQIALRNILRLRLILSAKWTRFPMNLLLNL